MKKIVLVLLACFLFVLTIVVSCGNFTGFKKNYSGTSTNSEITGTYELLDGTQTKTIDLKAGQTVTFRYSSTVDSGNLNMKVINSDGDETIEMEAGISGINSIVAGQDNTYTLKITGVNTQGSFDVSWTIK